MWELRAQGSRRLPGPLRRSLEALPGASCDAFEETGILEFPDNALSTPPVELLFEHFGLDPVPGDPHWTPWAPVWLPPVRPLFQHQTAAAGWLCEQGGGLLADDMGLGKTASALVAAQNLRVDEKGRPKPVLIVGPRYTRASWRNEMRALGIDDELFLADGFTPRTPDSPFWFCHYEILSKWVGHFRVNRWGAPRVIIIDEGHWAKNPKSGRGKACRLAARMADHRIVLTGTPLPNKPKELWTILDMLEPGCFGSHFDFRVRYNGAAHDGYGFKDGYPTHMRELRSRLTNLYMRREKHEVAADLPPLVHAPVLVDMQSNAKRSKHDQLVASGGGMATLVHQLQRGGGSTETFKLFAKLRRLTSRAKERTTLELVQSILDQGQSAVVFVHERKTADKLAEKIAKRFETVHETFVGVCHGAYEQEDRDALVAEFQAFDEGPGVLFATYGALKEGVTLHKASQVVIHDLSWVMDEILQAECRIHRIGQTETCTSHWVIVEDSFDMIFAQHLITKARAQAGLLGLDQGKLALAELGFVDTIERATTDLLAHFKSMEGERV